MHSKLDSVLVQPQTAVELQRYIERNSVDLRSINLSQFRQWLTSRIEEASTQELFRLRCWIRDVRTTHRRRLVDRQKRLTEAQQAYEHSPATVEFEHSRRDVESLTKGVEGLAAAVTEGRASPDKLQQFEQRLFDAKVRLLAAQAELNTPEKKRLDRANASWLRLQQETGLADAEAQLAHFGDRQGTASGSAGSRFETISSQAARDFIIPGLDLDQQQPIILHGATLECPRGELDQLVITHDDPGMAQVHAVVEAKNNINDLAHGFRVRQENLAWFVGDSRGFDPSLYRSDRFPHGRFEGPAVMHKENEIAYRFDSTSFSLFWELDHPPYRLQRLYFVTERRPLLGLDSGDLNRLMYRVATDHRFDIQSDTKLKRLYAWLLGLLEPMQTVDVLRLYAQNDRLASHILMVSDGQ